MDHQLIKPLMVHTTAAFNFVGTSTLVAFAPPTSRGTAASQHSGLSDNLGHTWNLLTDPT
jgi:hypothetical protein